MATSIFTTTVADSIGRAVALSECAGRVTVIVNAASLCSFAPRNMEMFAQMQQHYSVAAPGKTQILMFPSHDFAHQETRLPEEFLAWAGREFHVEMHCLNSNQGVTLGSVGDGGGCPVFLFGRAHVKTMGANWRAPAVWEQLAAQLGPPKWNWTKYVCAANGQPLVRLEPIECSFAILKREVDLALAKSGKK